MAKFAKNRAMRNLESAANSTIKTTGKAAVGLARWATTDHSGMSRAMSSMPKMGFLDGLGYILTSFLISMAGVVPTAGLMCQTGGLFSKFQAFVTPVGRLLPNLYEVYNSMPYGI